MINDGFLGISINSAAFSNFLSNSCVLQRLRGTLLILCGIREKNCMQYIFYKLKNISVCYDLLNEEGKNV